MQKINSNHFNILKIKILENFNKIQKKFKLKEVKNKKINKKVFNNKTNNIMYKNINKIRHMKPLIKAINMFLIKLTRLFQ